MSAAKADSTTGFRGQNLPAALEQNLLNIDGTQHRRVRRLAAAAFAVHPHDEHVVAAAVSELLTAMPVSGTIDLMADLCEPLPPRVIGALLGLSPKQLDQFRAAAATRPEIGRLHPVAALLRATRFCQDLDAGQYTASAIGSEICVAVLSVSDRRQFNDPARTRNLLPECGYPRRTAPWACRGRRDRRILRHPPSR